MKKTLILMVVLICGALSGKSVTFNVQVPSGTQKCFVCGAFNDWNDAEAVEMSPNGKDLFTLTLDDVSDVSGGFKYLCGQSWDYVEKDSNGDEIDNRTVPGNPDVVGSWRSVPEYGIESVELTVNGVKRLIKVYLPDGYEESTDTYPVIYYNTVQQRYDNAGAEGDAGDYFFGQYSWNAHSQMETLRQQGGKPYVMVQICSFLAENTPEKNQEYEGSGDAASYLTAFTGELMPYVEKTWRVKKGAESTTIIGADYGAVFSVYAALTRPDLFGNCVAVSPMLWINDGVLEDLASSAAVGQNYLVCAGSLEPDWMTSAAKRLSDALENTGAKVSYIIFNGGKHNDESWGKNFSAILNSLNGIEPASAEKASMKAMMAADGDFASNKYALFAASNASYVATTFRHELEYIDEYCKKGTSEIVPAFVTTFVIGTNYKNSYYWNVASDWTLSGSDYTVNSWVMPTNGSVTFNSSKSVDSWLHVAVFEDGTAENYVVNSQKFRVMVGDKENLMTTDSNFVASATVEFPENQKSFVIKYGSVNSGSLMSDALTDVINVSPGCTQAEIIYDFNLNKVQVKENVNDSSSVDPGLDSVPDLKPETEFKDRVYTLYAGDNKEALQKIGTFTYTEDFRKKNTDTSVNAMIITNDIPVSYQSKYYWNIAKGADETAGWLLGSPKDIGFSNKKTEISWHNIAIFEDETTADIAAHSKGFRVVTSKAETAMNQGSDHLSTANVSFPGVDKSFTINYGSVNSSSDMGAMTPTISVSETCVEAEITYDFHLNKVSVKETKFGENMDELGVTSFTAVPAVCSAGTNVSVSLVLNGECDVEMTCIKDFKDNVEVVLNKQSDFSYIAALDNTAEGLYTFTVSLKAGENTLKDAAQINVRVLPSGKNESKTLVVNAYKDIDWEKTGRYKSNFHTHTSQSFDTQYNTTQVVDKYQAAGYKILALTDHDASSYPWTMFSLYNSDASDRNPSEMGMLAIPGNELSKDRRNSWSESTGGEFNHHNDFFTGRKGQEFMSLRESYAYTEAIGGMQIINHPGQYWNLSTNYKAGEKNSPEWHAENFRLYSSLVGLEVYNQGNRRPNDRILWDQILTLTMPERPVWGYSCDDTHTAEQYFRNYQFMLMPELSVDALKEAMHAGATVFSYEYTGSGEDKAPHIKSISVDEQNRLITIDTDDTSAIEWISSVHRTSANSASSTKSTVVGIGKTFDYSGFQGSYVRARLVNDFGETATQPFGFSGETSSIEDVVNVKDVSMLEIINDQAASEITLICSEEMQRISVINSAGSFVKYFDCAPVNRLSFSTEGMTPGVYVVVAATNNAAYTAKFVKK